MVGLKYNFCYVPVWPIALRLWINRTTIEYPRPLNGPRYHLVDGDISKARAEIHQNADFTEPDFKE